MPLRLDVRKKLSSRSDRVKCVDLHPTEDWMLASLYNGNVHIWNYETQQIAKTFEVCDLPVRAAKFVARKHWVLTGSDDMKVRVFNYNTLERVHQFDAHADYIRSLAVHPTSSYILTSSDDMTIKLWDWDKKWNCTQVFEGHTHYVMQVAFNPKDNNSFVSASLDRTLKVWQLGSTSPNFTLEGHEKGVNCVAYYAGGDKPYLISGADDRNVKIWDYQNKACVQTLQGHAHNIAAVAFHPELPIILSGSEDGTFRIWHANTYRLESTLNYGMERGWSLGTHKGSNHVALGYDEGCVLIQLGREEPAMSMDSSGKILWAKHAEIQQANIKSLSSEAEVKDGEPLPLDFKDLGSSDLYPQSVRHNSNGRFVVVSGDGEYVVYTAMALRNKCFGSALEFVWSANDGNEYAIRENNSQVKIFKNFKEKTNFKPDFGAEGIFGGHLLGVKSSTGLAFYDWESAKIVRRIEIASKQVLWNESGTLVCIATEENFFILKYDAEAESKGSKVDEDGIEDAFDVVGEVAEVMRTGVWVGDCFIYTNSMNRLNYFVGGEIVTVSHLDKICYILGYLPKENRVFLGDKEMNVISYSLLLSVMEYQTCVMRQDFTSADQILPTIPKEHRNRVAHFLEKQGFKAQALAVTTDAEHQFDLALHLGDLKTAVKVAENPAAATEQKWKQLAEVATQQCDFNLAQHCLHQAEDFGGLLLMASAAGNAGMVETLGSSAMDAGRNNIAFLSYFILGKLEDCLEVLLQSNRLAEAAFFARTYLPSQISRVVGLWKESVGKKNAKAAAAIADPTDYENLFPGLRQCFQAENYLKTSRDSVVPALAYPNLIPNDERDIMAEVAAALVQGADLDPVFNPPAEVARQLAAEGEIPPVASPIVAAKEEVVFSAPPLESSTAASSVPPPTAPSHPAEGGDGPTAAEETLISMLGDEPLPRAHTPTPAEPGPSVDSSAVDSAIVLEAPLSREEINQIFAACHAAATEQDVENDNGGSEEIEAVSSAPRKESPSPIPVARVESLAPISTADVKTPDSAIPPVSTPAFFQSFVSAPFSEMFGSMPATDTTTAVTEDPVAEESSASPEIVVESAVDADSIDVQVASRVTPEPVIPKLDAVTVTAELSSTSSLIGTQLAVVKESSPVDLIEDVPEESASELIAPQVIPTPSANASAEISLLEQKTEAENAAPPETLLDVGAAAAPPEISLLKTEAPANPTPTASNPALFQSFTSAPFDDLFDAAIQTLKSEPEAKLDQLDLLGCAGVEVKEPTLANEVSEDASGEAAEPLLNLDAPLIPSGSTKSDVFKQNDCETTDLMTDERPAQEMEINLLASEHSAAEVGVKAEVDPFDAWEEDVEAPAEKAASPLADAAAAVGNVDVTKGVTKAEEDLGDDWGDDAWGEDFEEEDAAADAAAKSADAPPAKMRTAPKTLDVDEMLDAELDLDLDDINLDNVDTTDLNLSDDLLSD